MGQAPRLETRTCEPAPHATALHVPMASVVPDLPHGGGLLHKTSAPPPSPTPPPDTHLTREASANSYSMHRSLSSGRLYFYVHITGIGPHFLSPLLGFKFFEHKNEASQLSLFLQHLTQHLNRGNFAVFLK